MSNLTYVCAINLIWSIFVFLNMFVFMGNNPVPPEAARLIRAQPAIVLPFMASVAMILLNVTFIILGGHHGS